MELSLTLVGAYDHLFQMWYCAVYPVHSTVSAPSTRQVRLAQQLEVAVVEQHCCGDRPDSLPKKYDEGEGDQDVPGIGQGRCQPIEHVLSQRLVLDVLCGWLHLGAEEQLTYACRGSMLLKSGVPLAGHNVHQQACPLLCMPADFRMLAASTAVQS